MNRRERDHYKLALSLQHTFSIQMNSSNKEWGGRRQRRAREREDASLPRDYNFNNDPSVLVASTAVLPEMF